MKKILLVLTMALGTCLAVNAQSAQQSEESTAKDVNVQVQVAGQTTTAESGEVKEAGTSGTKACCSSKKGKSSSDAHCGDKKQRADAGTKKDNE